MELKYQQSAISYLKKLADADCHSILVSGISGSGKTYLATYFAKYKKIPTFHAIQPKVADLKELIDDSYRLDDDQVICIENLDKGKDAAAQVILKYLEEPLPNVYILVTCSNVSNIPATIRSRSIHVPLENPSKEDLTDYAMFVNRSKWELIQGKVISSVCKSLSEINFVLNLSLDEINYYESFSDDKFWGSSVDQIMWNIGHYDNNSKTDVNLSLRCLHKYAIAWGIKNCILEALVDLEFGRLSETAVLGRLALACKQGR